ncbi:acetyl/propionyl/methylcrotonyl-CoA carboxylase subunit alpha [Bowmanella sp. JS7-9]|uniref:Acetyl/propionyl/methylcrotonyl-CoA carboxylase subunit alpha n=1 Tax=Pseudobowmanella zhangzhouensis TaxID=1537679 RepID=A0ABW1XJW3_9ALTE|nr:acetyl/propionyl/methylcrotonyl-CoA carboxylase subunit alpha [Bowmanella sp. JS7-9]TBX23161.1 3-methylcrotonyl-CoA carboxylase [Bowmanella sp. JS7-9]
MKKLLIANRGEIACRVIKTAKKLGIKTVAVYSDADVNALHVAMADEAVHIGAAPSKESYLQSQRILDAALALGVDAIHPGYGFLSENAAFANACAANGIEFVGPPTGAIEAMGSKSAAKAIMEKAGVPLVPGYHGDNQDPAFLKQQAISMGFPVLLKAAAGGGGKGMRQVHSEAEFDNALAAAKREAMSSFGDDLMLVEKYLTQPRHVEIQVFCDKHGNGVYLFERDCSLQRRHQKVIEEAPAPGMQADLREQMGDAALKAAHAIGYVGAGTVEFLLDVDGSFYFMEMNTRLQVEHPVTEMITGEDLVEWQIRVADGEHLPKTQAQLQIKGHAFEARVYAEDPNNDFLPATGTLAMLETPQESRFVRVDTGVREGDDVSVYYDPMIAKLIVWDENRDKALARLQSALRDYRICGMTTNLTFLHALASHPAFAAAELDTNFIHKHEQRLFAAAKPELSTYLVAGAVYLALKQAQDTTHIIPRNADIHSPWNKQSQWRANDNYHQTVVLSHDEQQQELVVSRHHAGHFAITAGTSAWEATASLDGRQLSIAINGVHQQLSVFEANEVLHLFGADGEVVIRHVLPDLQLDSDHGGPADFAAPMNGTIVTHLVKTGEHVEKGTPLLVMEAMKMEHSIVAPTSGQVSEFYYQPGELVNGGADLLAFEADA